MLLVPAELSESTAPRVRAGLMAAATGKAPVGTVTVFVIVPLNEFRTDAVLLPEFVTSNTCAGKHIRCSEKSAGSTPLLPSFFASPHRAASLAGFPFLRPPLRQVIH